VSTSVARQSQALHSTLSELSKVQGESLRVSRRNVDLTEELLQLAAEANQRKTGNVDDQALQEQITTLEGELKASRQKWKIIKGTVSAVVAGSGVDWVGEPHLRGLVLDPEDDV
jgi:predicted RNase H-like nuclease (RuvC/YqgF family)